VKETRKEERGEGEMGEKEEEEEERAVERKRGKRKESAAERKRGRRKERGIATGGREERLLGLMGWVCVVVLCFIFLK
jgi:hypothetical protein